MKRDLKLSQSATDAVQRMPYKHSTFVGLSGQYCPNISDCGYNCMKTLLAKTGKTLAAVNEADNGLTKFIALCSITAYN